MGVCVCVQKTSRYRVKHIRVFIWNHMRRAGTSSRSEWRRSRIKRRVEEGERSHTHTSLTTLLCACRAAAVGGSKCLMPTNLGCHTPTHTLSESRRVCTTWWKEKFQSFPREITLYIDKYPSCCLYYFTVYVRKTHRKTNTWGVAHSARPKAARTVNTHRENGGK